MRARSLLAPLLFLSAVASSPACSQTPVVVPLRSMERPKDVDFICLEDTNRGTWRGTALENCALNFDSTAKVEGKFALHAVVSQLSRGEVAVVDLGRVPRDQAYLRKVDPRLPGYSFIPVGAAPTDIVADPTGAAVYVSSGRDPRIDILPAEILRGPIDTSVAQDPPPWPHIDFDRATEGIPSAMTIVREGELRRLYVTLPEATPSAKIAVFDLKASALTPPRIGDIALGAPAPVPLVVKPSVCGPNGQVPPWWDAYDKCPPSPENHPIVAGEVTPDPTATEFHPAGVNVVAGRMFVADDRAPVIHVYDVRGGAGVEIRRIAIGSVTARVAVSPVVPDEVTPQNSKAIDICIARGWLGDGLDHSPAGGLAADAQSTVVGEQLQGRCRAHRYLYAIDLQNDDAGNGSVAIVDLPVTYGLDASNRIKLTADNVPAEENIDLDGAELVQPMACDGPNFPARRLPLGPFGLSGNNLVPARSIAFLEVDPQRNANESYRAVRCRPTETLAADEFQGVPAAEAEARKRLGEEWSSGVGPRRLRGVFAWVALANGALTVVDIDDYDSTCRGLQTSTDKTPEATIAETYFRYPGEEAPIQLGPKATNEYYGRVVRRHHPRSQRVFDANLIPSVSGVTFSRFDDVLSNDPANSQGQKFPHFAALAPKPTTTSRTPVVLPSPDNPYAITAETWTVTYEGTLPGFNGTFASLNDEGGVLVARDPAAGFCRNGVEATGPVEQHDVIQLLDEPCAFSDSCSPEVRTECLREFGEATLTPLKRPRSLFVEKAHDDKLVLGNKHWAVTTTSGGAEGETIVDGPANLALIKQCFGSGLLRYAVRSSGSWVVVGSTSGFLHRQMVDATSTDKACTVDATKPRIHQGRTKELAALDVEKLKSATPLEDNLVTSLCERFVNPSWQFAIRRGVDCTTDASTNITTCFPTASTQDMRFTFGGRFSWQPFSIGAGSLTASLKPVAAYWDGVERLNWNMIAVVDAVDRGLLLFPALEPFSFQKGAN